ncbi:antibiotic biosynthesis monooxygenase [Leptolyngbya sp. GB1-A1]|uniref:antibiotic biosynthesis monooxygenase family protein n=1 Tax=Leptolyngbya sp. GB1-A1 TaxID=2933908 RepID=UPI0032968D74
MGDRVTHLAKFRMMPVNQPEMVKRTTTELDRAMNNSPGLVSASFHRSLDGTRMFNYGQWKSKEAFEAILKQPGFNPDKPYWEGLARSEFYLYHVVYVEATWYHDVGVDRIIGERLCQPRSRLKNSQENHPK